MVNRKERRQRGKQKCSCGSGLQYRHCHGKAAPSKTGGLQFKEIPASEIPFEVLEQLRGKQRKRTEFEAMHGHGRPIVSLDFNDLKVVVSGNEINYSPIDKTKFFPDFLNGYLKRLLTPEWHKEQLVAPPEKQHQLWKWYVSLCNYQQTLKPDPDGSYRQEPTGAMLCWNRLAYDLFLVKHNASLQKTLLERLKDSSRFQAARFELCAAACMVVAGYKIAFENESDNKRKHPEFIATHANGYSIAVEAKSRHRDGVLGFKGGKASDKIEIEGLLRDALSKDVRMPYYIFVDVNLPLTDKIGEGNPWFLELSQSVNNLYAEWDRGTFPANGVFFCNDPSHYSLDSLLKPCPPFWCYEIPFKEPRFPLSNPDIHFRIGEATIQRGNIPNEFPD